MPKPLSDLLDRANNPYFSAADFAASVRITELPLLIDAVALAEQALAPGGPEKVAELVKLVSQLPGRAVSEQSAELALRVFVIGLKDVPLDLLRIGAEKACMHCKFRPAPVEVRAFIEDELEARRAALRKLRHAQSTMQQPAANEGYGDIDVDAILAEHNPQALAFIRRQRAA